MAPTKEDPKNSTADGLRLDKWLWAARFFKTRELAAKSCDIGRVEVNGLRAKPSRTVRLGDALVIKNEGGIYEVEVLVLSEVRGPAAQAQGLFRESEASRRRRELEAEQRKAAQPDGMALPSKPSRRDRSSMDRLRGR